MESNRVSLIKTMSKKNTVKITREKTLETIEKELYDAMNILDEITKRINEALKKESDVKDNLTNSQNLEQQTDSQTSISS